uniref:Uncharacterized protein n=1 Tax=Arundo donax TaxID=35708 RepID=A0A0A9ELW5_ARUDO
MSQLQCFRPKSSMLASHLTKSAKYVTGNCYSIGIANLPSQLN